MTSRLSVHTVAVHRSQIAIRMLPRTPRRSARAIARYDARRTLWGRLMYWIVG